MLSSATTRSVSQFIGVSSRRVTTSISSNTTSTCSASKSRIVQESLSSIKSIKSIQTSSSTKRHLSASTNSKKPTVIHKKVSPEERAALRQARKEQSIVQSQQARSQQAQSSSSTSSSSAATNASSSTSSTTTKSPYNPVIVYGLGVAIPTSLLAWGVYDHDSPPAKVASFLGFDEVFDSFAKPTYEKLLPNWNDMPNVPKDLNPMTLVIDLENTLVNSTWDRKHGWRTAKRPGAVKFLRELAQYYEIVIFTPSHEGLGLPIMDALQNESGGAIMHYLYRDACYYKNGTYMKDLSKLNRNISRVILIDDDEDAAALNPENLVKVKAYTDPKDRKDDTLERLIPFLVEIATENYKDARVVLGQFKGMDADEIANELEQRVNRLQNVRNNRRGLGSWSNAGKMDLPTPEMAPVDRNRRKGGGGISSKDLVGGESPPGSSSEQGLSGWLSKRQEKQAKEKMEKMEHWNKLLMERSEEKRKQEMSSD